MVKAGFYDQKADMFSIGAMLCQMLSGWHPFYTPQVDDAKSVQAKIVTEKPVSFPEDVFGSISEEARDLCQRLLEKDPKKRLSAGQALAHPWFRNPSMPSPYGNINTGVLNPSVFEGLKQYCGYNKLRRGASQLLAQDLSEEQLQELREAFLALDAAGDGLLSPEELAEGAKRVDYELSLAEAEHLVAVLGGPSLQRAGYREFIAALADCQVEYNLQQVQSCFQKLSTDGVISYQDVIHATRQLGGHRGEVPVTETEWHDLLHSLPSGRKLNFEAFQHLMGLTPSNCQIKAINESSVEMPNLIVMPAELPSLDMPRKLWSRCTEPFFC